MPSTLSPMNPQRKTAIREILVAHASAEPGRSGLYLSSEPSSRRPLVAAVALRAAASITAVAVVASDPTAPSSYASWTAVPETAP